MVDEDFVVERFDPEEYIKQKDNEEKVGTAVLFWMKNKNILLTKFILPKPSSPMKWN